MDTEVLPKIRVRSIEHDLEPWRESKRQYKPTKIYKSKHTKKKISNKTYEITMLFIIFFGVAVCAWALGYIMGAGIW